MTTPSKDQLCNLYPRDGAFALLCVFSELQTRGVIARDPYSILGPGHYKGDAGNLPALATYDLNRETPKDIIGKLWWLQGGDAAGFIVRRLDNGTEVIDLVLAVKWGTLPLGVASFEKQGRP